MVRVGRLGQLDSKERSALGKSGVLLVAGVLNGLVFGFDWIAALLLLGAPVVFLGQYLPARRRRLAEERGAGAATSQEP